MNEEEIIFLLRVIAGALLAITAIILAAFIVSILVVRATGVMS